MEYYKKVIRTVFSILAGFFISFQSFSGNGKEDSIRKSLLSQFTESAIIVDGIAESEWNDDTPSPITIFMNSQLSEKAPACTSSGEVHSLWNGALVYLLISVSDADICTAGKTVRDRDGVEIFLNFWNDKFPKS